MSENTKQETDIADNVETKPVGGETAEPEAASSEPEASKESEIIEPESIPPEPEIAKGSETEAGEEIVGKSETPVTLDAEEYRKLKAQTDKAKEYLEGLQRERADFINYKKRAAQERSEAIEKAKADLLASLVPALDNFDMAMDAIENAGQSSVDSLKKGVCMVFKHLNDAILESGMEEINAAVGQMFNPHLHEAVEERENSEVPKGQVIEQIRKGYKLKDRLIRPARVVVAKAKAALLADEVGNKSSAEESSAEN